MVHLCLVLGDPASQPLSSCCLGLDGLAVLGRSLGDLAVPVVVHGPIFVALSSSFGLPLGMAAGCRPLCSLLGRLVVTPQFPLSTGQVVGPAIRRMAWIFDLDSVLVVFSEACEKLRRWRTPHFSVARQVPKQRPLASVSAEQVSK